MAQTECVTEYADRLKYVFDIYLSEAEVSRVNELESKKKNFILQNFDT